MTPDEMGQALGDGWSREVDDHAVEWYGGKRLGVRYGRGNDSWWVDVFGSDGQIVGIPCSDGGHAAAAAHLLVAAEQIAGGADVTPAGEELRGPAPLRALMVPVNDTRRQ